jgi:hypothetical protein
VQLAEFYPDWLDGVQNKGKITFMPVRKVGLFTHRFSLKSEMFNEIKWTSAYRILPKSVTKYGKFG